MASRYWRTPDCATPSAMMRSTLRGSATSALSARAIAPVSRCARYSTPAGERYSTDCADRGAVRVTAAGGDTEKRRGAPRDAGGTQRINTSRTEKKTRWGGAGRKLG